MKAAIAMLAVGAAVVASGLTAHMDRATAVAQPAVEQGDPAFNSADYQRAADAALRHMGGGKVQDVDRENEGGATWEVEMTTPDGRFVEVHLDNDFRVLSTSGERDANEGADDDANEGPDDD